MDKINKALKKGADINYNKSKDGVSHTLKLVVINYHKINYLNSRL